MEGPGQLSIPTPAGHGQQGYFVSWLPVPVSPEAYPSASLTGPSLQHSNT